MDKVEREPMEKWARKLARDITFKLILIPAVSLVILSIVLIMVFSPMGFLHLLSWTVMGWIIVVFASLWFVWAAIVQVFAIEPKAFTGQMRLPLSVNLACTLPIVLVGVSIGLSFIQMGLALRM